MVLLTVSGCSRHYHPLESAKKAKLVAETISNSSKCSEIKNRLTSKGVDDDEIDDLFHEAMRAQCINRDI